MQITKAIITVAGYGTRFIPATKVLPKEMLPIVDKPIVQYLVEEAAASGITDVILVTRSGGHSLEDHFDSSRELELHLEAQKNWQALEAVRKASSLANIVYVRQGRNLPYGNGTPLLCARPLIAADEAVAYMFGDDLVRADVPCVKQLIEVYQRYQPAAVVAVQQMPKSEISAFAVPKLKPGTDRNEIERMIEKPTPDQICCNLAQFGRFILGPAVIQAIGETKTGRGGELWLTDAIDQIARTHSVLVHEIEGRWFTTGDPLNYLKTTVEYALANEELGPRFAEFLRTLKLE
jgi:UTP--glucose-1-phosphate uridylyltransferase